MSEQVLASAIVCIFALVVLVLIVVLFEAASKLTFVEWLAAIFVGIVLANLGGCQQTPQYRLPTAHRKSYNLPPCELVSMHMPCRGPVVRENVSACDKRFGKKLCEGK